MEQLNQLTAPPAGSPEAPPQDLLGHMMASYGKLQEAQKQQDVVRQQLDRLRQLGDAVTQEDVIDGAGKAVAAGLAPEAMAAMLADMPEKGEQIAEWIAQHDIAVTQREEQLKQVTEQVRHHMGAQALRELMRQGPQEQPTAPGEPLATPVNALGVGNG